MIPIWLPSTRGEQRLAWVRPIATHDGLEVQGVLLDWHRLRELLALEVSDLFPDAAFEPDPQPSVRTPTKMCNLPVSLNVSPPDQATVNGWTSLRVGLVLAWLAAAVALTVVGWGGWTMLELSERRHQFVSAVTHELRTPLTTLRLYLGMLADGMVQDEAQRTEYLHTLCAQSDRLAGLIGNVLDYARLDNGQSKGRSVPLAVQPFLAEVRHVSELSSGPAGKCLIIEDQTPEGSMIYTDPGLVRQILANLLDNAFKHTAGSCDTRVWLRASRQPDGRIAFEVEDCGPGIPLADQKRIFAAFWRGPGNNGCPAPGVGLGLALARRWAKLLGAVLRVESPVRNHAGTRFILIVDRRRNSPSTDWLSTNPKSEARNPKQIPNSNET